MHSTDKRRRLAAPLAGILVAILAWSPHLWGQRPAARRLPVDLEAIVDVDGDAAGRLYVIEDRRNRLLVLDSTFAIMAEVPNDPSDSATVVMAQSAIRVLDRGRFVRLERYLRRLDVFEWRGRKVAKVRATRFPFELWDACHAGGDTQEVVVTCTRGCDSTPFWFMEHESAHSHQLTPRSPSGSGRVSHATVGLGVTASWPKLP